MKQTFDVIGSGACEGSAFRHLLEVAEVVSAKTIDDYTVDLDTNCPAGVLRIGTNTKTAIITVSQRDVGETRYSNGKQMWVKDAKRNGELKIYYQVGPETRDSAGADSPGSQASQNQPRSQPTLGWPTPRTALAALVLATLQRGRRVDES